MKTFEYRTEVETGGSGAPDWERLGLEGWELIAVTHSSWQDDRKGYEHDVFSYYFKRERLSFRVSRRGDVSA